MKILVFNGSPKREKSDTMHMTRAFLKGIEEVSQNDVHIINVIDKHIEYCKGCFVCKKNGGECVIKDDMKEILEEILMSDLLIFNFPLYCFGMPANLKVLIDRTMPMSSMAMKKVGDRYEHESQFDFSKLKYVMICGSGFPSLTNNFEPMINQFKLMFGEDDSTILTVSESPMFNAPEADVVTKPFLKNFEQAGREYILDGKVSEETLERLSVPMIPPEQYEKICNGEV